MLLVTVQVVPTGLAAPFAAITITSPIFPWLGVRAKAVKFAALDCGIATEEIDTNSAEMSSTTRNKELDLRLVNSEHATMNSHLYII